jgi:hypothetical protein
MSDPSLKIFDHPLFRGGEGYAKLLVFSLGNILIPEFRGFPQVAVEEHRHQKRSFSVLQKSIKFFSPNFFFTHLRWDRTTTLKIFF